MFICVPSNIWCCIYDYFIFLLYISTYLYILIIVLNKCYVNTPVCEVVLTGLRRKLKSHLVWEIMSMLMDLKHPG